MCVCVCVCVCVQAISKLGVLSQNLILLPKSGPSNDGCGRGTALPRHTDACLRGMWAGIHGPGQRGSPPTRQAEGIFPSEVFRLVPLTFSKPSLIPACHPQPHLDKNLLSLSGNPEARIRLTGDCQRKWGLRQARPSTKGNKDVCWPLDSRKTAHSRPHPPGSSGGAPSLPLASIDLDAPPSEWGLDLTLCPCPLGNLGRLQRRRQGCGRPSAGWVPGARGARHTGSRGERRCQPTRRGKPVPLPAAPQPNQHTEEGAGGGVGRTRPPQEELTRALYQTPPIALSPEGS